MDIFSGAKKNDELVLVFNIGSSSVGGALFVAQESGIPKIIFAARELVKIEEKIEADRFLTLTLQALEIVVNKVYKAGMGAPSKIFCILSSPWHISQVRTINLKKNTPFIFNEKLAEELIQKEIKLFEEEHLAQYGSSSEAVRTIEFKNIKVMLNGYETAKPLNQKTTELEMTIFISMSGESVLRKIEETIARSFHFEKVNFSPFTLASFAVVRDIFIKQENFLLVNISGEMTDIFMVKKNALRESVSFPLGRNFLIRGVSARLHSTLNEADSLISLFKDNHAEAAVAKKLSPIIDQLRSDWLKKFQESLANLSHDISIPATVYIALDKDLADFFLETIKTEQFSQYTLTESKFEVIFLNAEILHGLALFAENIIREPFLVIDSIYINRFLMKK